MEKLDIIGDVHGYASKLKALLEKMGYILKNDTYIHPEGRRVVYVGDYIDRGLEEFETLKIVKNMVEAGSAEALMGNHEYNAICYATEIDGVYLRKHSERNNLQHKAFLKEFPFGTIEYKEMIEWFKTLPLFIEKEHLRFVHASWINEEIEHLRTILTEDNKLKDDIYKNLLDENHKDYKAIEVTLKGVERILPNGMEWTDKIGIARNTIRINWYSKIDDPTYQNMALSMSNHNLPNTKIKDFNSSYRDKELVFFGHYWMTGTPKKTSEQTACLDYSVAKDGELVAYRFEGEKEILDENFFF